MPLPCTVRRRTIELIGTICQDLRQRTELDEKKIEGESVYQKASRLQP